LKSCEHIHNVAIDHFNIFKAIVILCSIVQKSTFSEKNKTNLTAINDPIFQKLGRFSKVVLATWAFTNQST